VPLFISTGKKEVIILVAFGGGGGLSEEDLSPRVSLMYKAKQWWFGYLKKRAREFMDS